MNTTRRGSPRYRIATSRHDDPRSASPTTTATSTPTSGGGPAHTATTSPAARTPSGPVIAPSAELQLLSPADVADACRLSRKTIYRAIERGELKASKMGNRLRVSTHDCRSWLDSNTVPGTTPQTVTTTSTVISPRRRIRNLVETQRP